MAEDQNDEIDEPDDVPFRTLLPPDDRTWRHPSELGQDEERRVPWWRFRRSARSWER